VGSAYLGASRRIGRLPRPVPSPLASSPLIFSRLLACSTS
jgi:hypothetical protein